MRIFFPKGLSFNEKTLYALESLNDGPKVNPEEVLTRIYAANFSWLEQYVLQNSGNSDDARDIFQEAATAAWLSLQSGKFKGTNDQFNAYLRQICKYKWINELRSRTRKKISYPEVFPETEHADTDNLQVSELQQSAVLNKCFFKLGEKCRNILSLFYYKKKPIAEIATEMQNTEESIKTIKYRCMMQLRKLFLEEMKKDGEI